MPAARNTDPLHSHLAAATITDQSVSMLQVRLLALFQHFGPLCDHELIHHYGLFVDAGDFPPASESGIRSRRSELAEQEPPRLIKTGAIAYTLSGNRTTVWAVPAIPAQRAA